VDFGIIIDSAVVLVEALMVRLTAHHLMPADEAGRYGWRLHTLKHTAVTLGHPILFSKAIIILAFLPIFTFQHVEGKIFSPMAFTLSFALLGAILLTLTLVPALLTYALKHSDMAEKHSAWMLATQERYRRCLTWCGQHRWFIGVGSVALLALSIGLAPLLGSEFLPKLDEGNIWLTITLPPLSPRAHGDSMTRTR
jgi:cobalt-zinc-cadmium resistance protein CzcA